MRFDVVVLLSFVAFYFLAAYSLAQRVCRRFPLRESWLRALLCTVGASILVSFAGMLMLETLSFFVESFRHVSSHLSDRANRIPWPYIRIPLFTGGLILFWLAAALRYRAARRDAEVYDYYCSLHLHHWVARSIVTARSSSGEQTAKSNAEGDFTPAVPREAVTLVVTGKNLVTSDFDVLDLSATEQIRPWGDFNLSIDNLTDKRYFETQNYFESRVSPGAASARAH
jgi:hypothetical protein